MEKYQFIWNHLKQNNVKPQFFGLGFIQCKISLNERYHFYHDSLEAIINEEEVHDHRYDFVSTIIKGQLSNKIYEFIKEENGLYVIEEESCNKDIIIENNRFIRGNINLLLQKTYSPNELYFMDNNTLHTITAKNCITHLKRTNYKKEYAHVVRPVDKNKICPFSKEIKEEECWCLIREMLEIYS